MSLKINSWQTRETHDELCGYTMGDGLGGGYGLGGGGEWRLGGGGGGGKGVRFLAMPV